MPKTAAERQRERRLRLKSRKVVEIMVTVPAIQADNVKKLASKLLIDYENRRMS